MTECERLVNDLIVNMGQGCVIGMANMMDIIRSLKIRKMGKMIEDGCGETGET
jgi:hypothetical protein